MTDTQDPLFDWLREVPAVKQQTETPRALLERSETRDIEAKR